MKKKKIIIITSTIVLLLILLITIVIILNNPTTTEEIEYNKGDFYQLNLEEENDSIKNQIITSEEELLKLFPDEKTNKYDFTNNNYALFVIFRNTCGEDNINPSGYLYENNTLTIQIKYEASCGVCALENLYYLLKIDKSIEDTEIRLDYKALNNPHCDPTVAYKPMIYIYPQEDKLINIKLGNEEVLKITYPEYNNGWEVLAKIDGTLIDKNNREYYGLFWEGYHHPSQRKEIGFIIERKDTRKFLEEKLELLGLNDKEANEFIVYWLPILEENPYNYIYFETEEEINKYMPLEITPTPDSIIRIQMDYQPLKEKEEVQEQTLTRKERKGYSIIEWGGSKITAKKKEL